MLKAVMSDVHGNLEALEAVVADAKEKGAEEFIFLGDYVGYGPNPVECIEAVQELGKEKPVKYILGNHDASVVALASGIDANMLPGNPQAVNSWVYSAKQLLGGFELDFDEAKGKSMEKLYRIAVSKFSERYQAGIDELRKKTKEANRRLFGKRLSMEDFLLFLSSSELVKECVSAVKDIERGQNALGFLKELQDKPEIRERNAHYVHGCPVAESEYTDVYVLSKKQAAGHNVNYRTPQEVCELYKGDAKFLFCGHSHFQTLPMHLKEVNSHVLVMVGSVGNSRDKHKEPKAEYAAYDDERDDPKAVKLYKVGYEWKKTQQKCDDAGLGEIFAK